jgi:hypothetical protein
MTVHAGGCLCGTLRYQVVADPLRVTLCHCRFCQRATGGAYMVEAIFRQDDLVVTKGTPTVYETRSAGSGKTVRVHFCPACGTKLHLSFERFPGIVGVYAGTFDEPSWIRVGSDNAKQIFVDVARPDSVLLPDIDVFGQHAMLNDGTPLQPVRFDRPHIVCRRGSP